MKNEINKYIEEISNQLHELIVIPDKVTVNLQLYRSFFSNINQFAIRYHLCKTDEWHQVDKWLIKKSTEFLTLDEAMCLMRAIEPLRERALSSISSKVKVYEYDVFISHANSNKEEFVDSLKNDLSKLGISIWYDSTQIDWGDNLKVQIHNGLDKCRFGIIVISPEFLGRDWTEIELHELFQRQNKSGQKVVLPLLYNLSIEEMKKSYPALADFKAQVIKTNNDIKDISIDFARILIHALKSELS